MPGLKVLENCQLSSPRLYFERLVILRRPIFKPENVIHEIFLHRGLNIVLGRNNEDLTSIDRPDFSASGHSVGKSSFCRLIRYILTEPDLGSNRHREQLQRALPEAWVAAELMLDGQKWAIGKSLSSKGKHPLIGRDVNLEALFQPDFSSLKKEEYEAAIVGLLPTGLNLPDRHFTWLDFLAWLTRDQNARLRNFWSWREPVEENYTNKSGIFNKHTTHPRHLVQGVLKLLPTENEKMQQKLHELNKEKERVATQIVDLEAKPRNERAAAKSILKRYLNLAAYDDQENDDNSLFGLLQTAKNHLFELENPLGQIADLERQLSVAEKESSLRFHKYQRLEAELREIVTVKYGSDEKQSALGKNEIKIPDTLSRTEFLDSEIKKLESRNGTPCENVDELKIGNCSHVLAYLEALRAERKSLIPLSTPGEQQTPLQLSLEPAMKDQSIASKLAAKYEQLKKDHQEAQELYKETEAERVRLKNELHNINRKVGDIKATVKELETWNEYLSGNLSDPELAAAIKRQDGNENAIQELTAQLNAAQQEAKRHSDILQSLFAELVGNIFGQDYTGVIFNNKKELDFQILNNGQLSGAVTETLAIILGDMAAMLSSALGLSYHPGFHVHDSPREADLSAALYRWLFKVIADISTQLGGPENAPFQYIITTTTPPPPELATSVCLELAANPPSAYLFGECLHSEKTLFSEILDHID